MDIDDAVVATSSEGDAVARFTAYLAGTTRWELGQADKIMGVIRIALMEGNETIFLGLEQEARRRATPLMRRLWEDASVLTCGNTSGKSCATTRASSRS